jgi:hypothetical protein
LSKELVSQLYSTEPEVKKAAVYRLLFDRRHDLLTELKKAVAYEPDEEMAVFMVQVGLTLEAFPRDASLERRIIEILQRENGAADISRDMWKYLENHGSSRMLEATLAAMGDAIPPDAQEFIESCLNHPDPEIRASACAKAIKSGRPTHFAYVLNLITDPDPLVSETAFWVIREMPVNALAIILDYALGSPDEWVLHNVAPFLPLLINNGLRQVIAKVQYHKHPLVAKKAKKALKVLDSIPYVSKRAKNAETDASADTDETLDPAEKTADPVEQPLSFKEQMERKRLQKMEEERQRKAEEDALAAELAKVKPEDIAEFSDQLAGFGEVAAGGLPAENSSDDLEQALEDDGGLAAQAAVLHEVDENLADMERADLPVPAQHNESGVVSPETAVNDSEDLPSIASVNDETEKSAGLIDLAGAAADGNRMPELQPAAIASIDLMSASVSAPTASVPESDDLKAADVAILAATDDIKVEVHDENPLKQGGSGEPVPVSKPAGNKPANMSAISGPAREIISRYPSFLSDPFLQIFQSQRHDVQLKNINLVVDNLIAFLNLCYLQSCLFFASHSEMLDKSINECLKGHLAGPTALRCLHNFALAMKKARGNPVFFTFSLAGILGESSDANPLMMIRELKEYLRDPVTPVEETIPEAIDGLTEILKGVKSILNNSLVMKAPPGAKEPFADLSGPEARILEKDRRPALDLPVGEVVLISRDGTEALGLFPFFKYARKKVVYNRPDENEMKILLERLEITQ